MGKKELDGKEYYPSWGEAGGTTVLIEILIKEIKGLRKDVKKLNDVISEENE